MEFKLVRDGFRNYIQVEDIDVREEQYETQMMLQNDLSYFLKLEIRGINQDRKYCYCINSKQSLRRILNLKAIEYEELKEIFFRLLNALKQLKEYFLKEDSVYLDLDAIYAEIGKNEVYLCYIPGYYESIGIQVRNLMEQLMEAIDHTDQKAVVLVYGLYRITRQENYTLDDLEDFIGNIGESGKEKREKKSKNQGKHQQILDELFGGINLEDEEKKESKTGTEFLEDETTWNHNDLKEGMFFDKKKESKNHEGTKQEFYLDKKKRGKWWYIALVFDVVVGICITYLIVLLMSRGLNSKGIIGLGLLTLGFFGMSFLAAKKEEDAREEEEEMQKAILRSEQYQEDSWYEEEEFYEELKNEDYHLEENVNESGNQNKTTVLYEESVPKLISLGKKEEQILLDHFPFIIGSRKEGSDYAIMEKGVSRIHADISFEKGIYFITDLNSTNGTFLNEKEIETGKAVRLKEGDEIRIAKRRLIIEGIG